MLSRNARSDVDVKGRRGKIYCVMDQDKPCRYAGFIRVLPAALTGTLPRSVNNFVQRCLPVYKKLRRAKCFCNYIQNSRVRLQNILNAFYRYLYFKLLRQNPDHALTLLTTTGKQTFHRTSHTLRRPATDQVPLKYTQPPSRKTSSTTCRWPP